MVLKFRKWHFGIKENGRVECSLGPNNIIVYNA